MSLTKIVTMKKTVLVLAALLAWAAPAGAQRAGEISLGVGFGMGTRTGAQFSLKVMLSDEVGATCKYSFFVYYTSATCGAHLHVFGDETYYAIAELGLGRLGHELSDTPEGDPRRPVEHGIFVNTGLGADWRLPVEELGFYAGIGPAFFLFSDAGDVDEEGNPRRRGLRPVFAPVFFFDLGFQGYVVSK